MTRIISACKLTIVRMSTNASPNLVAIVGRPNVGKSTLFNRLIGERRSIVGDEPGITRDRIYGQVEWAGTKFSLIDTGGMVPDDDAVIPANIFKQAGMAIDEAGVLIWVVDGRTGITLLDDVIELLKTGEERHELAEETVERELRLAIVGRPNVGKSSLLNRILGEDRVIVSPVAGTTRDAIEDR